MGFCTVNWWYDNWRGVTQVIGEHLDTYKRVSDLTQISYSIFNFP